MTNETLEKESQIKEQEIEKDEAEEREDKLPETLVAGNAYFVSDEVEIEEEVGKVRFMSLMGELINALGKEDIDVTFPLADKTIHIPADCFKDATYEVEFEEDEDECELELTIEWKK